MNFNGIFFSSKQFSVQASLNEERISIDYVNFNTWLGGFKHEHCKTLSCYKGKHVGMWRNPLVVEESQTALGKLTLAGHFGSGVRKSEKFRIGGDLEDQ